MLSAALLTAPVLPAEEKVDLEAYQKIRKEAFDNSSVMDHLFYLTDVSGPRVTNSPGYAKAADWVRNYLVEIGVSNVHYENFPFGIGWAYGGFQGAMVEPASLPLTGFALAWTPGTPGAITGDVVLAVMRESKDLEAFKGKLRGKIVLVDNPSELKRQETVASTRYSDTRLEDMARATDPGSGRPGGTPPAKPAGSTSAEIPGMPVVPAFSSEAFRAQRETRRKFAEERNKFLKEEGALACLSIGTRNDGGTIFAGSGGSWESGRTQPPPSVAISSEQYNRMARLLKKNVPVQVTLDVQARYLTESTEAFNVIGELPGGAKKDEVVMIGAHLDSWHGGTGATDNGAGSAVMIEVMRILKQLNLPLDRTVRIGLWSGEEQGLLGSRAYVKRHYGDTESATLQPEHERLAAYFNIDNGAGKVRGIYLQANTALRPVFEEWLKPLHDLGAKTVTVRNTGGTDHQSFDSVGLPGFQFIQDPLEYNTRTHHSNMDVYDRVPAEDMKQIAAVVASFAYQAANRAEKLPRKPLPEAFRKKKDISDAKPAGTPGN